MSSTGAPTCGGEVGSSQGEDLAAAPSLLAEQDAPAATCRPAEVQRHLDVLTAMYPGWNITVTESAERVAWSAVRHSPPTLEQRAAGLLEAVSAPTGPGLAAILAAQFMILHQRGGR